MIRPSAGTALICILMAAVLAACGQDGANPSPQPRPKSTATLQIAQPASAAVIKTTQMHVQFILQGGRIVSVTSKDLTPDEGHIHLSIDGQVISMNYSLEQDVSLQGFAPGPHVLQAEFVAKDHAPFNPRVLAKLIFDYQPA
jgi:hypothetical protein